MTLLNRYSLFILGLLTSGASMAGSQIVTLNVPIRFENVAPEVTGFDLSCTVGPSIGSPRGSNLINVPLVKNAEGFGSFNGVQAVPITVQDAVVLEAKYYYCNVRFRPMNCGPKSSGSGAEACTPAPGTTIKAEVSGPIEKQ